MLDKIKKFQEVYKELREYDFLGNISSKCLQFSMKGLVKISEETGWPIEYILKNCKETSYPIEGQIKLDSLTLLAVTDYEEAERLNIEIIPQLAKIVALKKELKELEEAINV